MRVFLIETDPEFAECLRNILETEGFEVDWTDDLQSAAATIIEYKPALMVVDLHDGNTVSLEHIREISESLADSRILVTANYRNPEIACKAIGVGASDYLLKPFSTREIIERVHALTGDGSGSGAGTSSRLERISNSIRSISSFDDIVAVALDQLQRTLNLTDCLICTGNGAFFSVAASRGYTPNPVSKIILLTNDEINQLKSGCDDPLSGTISLARKIAHQFGIKGHRPFPTIMPLAVASSNGHGPDLIGFVMGHGALVVEETDILEIERFLSRISEELSHACVAENTGVMKPVFDFQGEFIIPLIDREDAVNSILEKSGRFLSDSSDTFWIRLVLDEAINNAILHGNGEPINDPVTDIKLKYFAGPEKLIFVVEDSGDGFNYLEIPDPTSDENLLNISGRGIFIMRNIMDVLIFNEKGNVVTMIKHLDGNPLGPSGTDLFGIMPT